MKFALIFLSIFVTVSQQQYYQHSALEFPWSPYARQLVPAHTPVPHFNEYLPDNYQIYEDNNLSPVNSRFSYQNAELSPALPVIGSPDDTVEYTGLRMINTSPKSFNSYPLYGNHLKQPRFFYLFNNGANVNYYNPFYRTVTSTSTVSVANVQSCIPAAQFNPANAANIPCGRRKREENNLQYDDSPEQYPIAPTETLRVTTTATSSLMEEMGVENNQVLHDNISSSQEEPMEVELTSDKHFREKRFFFNRNYFVVTSTSYLFVPTNIKQTVRPGVNYACLPSGYVVC